MLHLQHAQWALRGAGRANGKRGREHLKEVIQLRGAYGDHAALHFLGENAHVERRVDTNIPAVWSEV